MTQEEKVLVFNDLCARLPYHVRLKVWLSDDDCNVLGKFWRTESKEDFEKWANFCFSNQDFLDNGYMPGWHRSNDVI